MTLLELDVKIGSLEVEMSASPLRFYQGERCLYTMVIMRIVNFSLGQQVPQSQAA